jgi:selenocysteine lyase/cysteine desulfurase
MEHNSVLRPVVRLAQDRKARYDVFTAYSNRTRLTAKDILNDITSRFRPDTKAIVCIHSSNICSYSLPIREIGQFCRRHGLIFIVDAAQSAGHLHIDVEKDCIDVLCIPAHKGLYSPQGLGIMILRRGLRLDTLIEGGNGVRSLDTSMGDSAPERYEGGTLCLPAIAGLNKGIEFVRQLGIDQIAAHEKSLWNMALERLDTIRRVKIYDTEDASSIMLFNIDGHSPERVGEMLGDMGFCLRTGYHCSALAHKALGTENIGGVRIGFGVFNTEGEVDALCRAIDEIAHS